MGHNDFILKEHVNYYPSGKEHIKHCVEAFNKFGIGKAEEIISKKRFMQKTIQI